MDDWGMLIFVIIGAVVGGIYGLVVALRNKSKQKNQNDKSVEENKNEKV